MILTVSYTHNLLFKQLVKYLTMQLLPAPRGE